MYGYIVVNQDELRGREMKEYRRFYCGLCHALRRRYGFAGQSSVNYDSTFLAILLTGLYDYENVKRSRRCVVHPLKAQEYLENDAIEYAADMNVVLTYLKCRDDWRDEKKSLRYLYGRLLGARGQELSQAQGDKVRAIFGAMKHFAETERAAAMRDREEAETGQDACEDRQRAKKEPRRCSPSERLDALAAGFGDVLGEVFAWKNDEWQQTLREVGFHLGKFIYLLDAWDDLERDKKSGCFNPLIAVERRRTEENTQEKLRLWVHKLLELTAADCAAAFEQLPIIDYAEILRNILYSGMWTAYYKKEERR